MEEGNKKNSEPHNPDKDEIPDDKNNESDPDTDSDDGVDPIIVAI